MDAVQKAWGSVKGDPVGAGIYYSYPTHHVTIGINQGDQIFDVRSNDPSVQAVTRSDVIAALGPPGAVLYAANTTIYMYPDGTDYELLWVFSGGQGPPTGSTVDHVDVVWPQGTVDLMAQTLPNPGISIITQPGAQGSYMAFSITNPPTGYHLMEMEWLPSASGGESIVNTLPQALTNAQDNTPGSFMAINGHYRLAYTANMKGTTGKVRLIYENNAGDAIIGTSQSITLK